MYCTMGYLVFTSSICIYDMYYECQTVFCYSFTVILSTVILMSLTIYSAMRHICFTGSICIYYMHLSCYEIPEFYSHTIYYNSCESPYIYIYIYIYSARDTYVLQVVFVYTIYTMSLLIFFLLYLLVHMYFCIYTMSLLIFFLLCCLCICTFAYIP